MSIECAECEHDLRGGHDPDCSLHPDNRLATIIALRERAEKAEHLLRVVRDYPGMREYFGNQIADAINAAISSASSERSSPQTRPKPSTD